MGQTYKQQAYCESCRSNVLAERQSGLSDGMGCLLIILTAGFFLPIFLLLRIVGEFRPFQCPRCGSQIKGESNANAWIAIAIIVAILVGIFTFF